MALLLNTPARRLFRERPRPVVLCPACERAVLDLERSVRLHDDIYHAECALYRRHRRP
ncbi:MAG: hypothetical protein QOC77_2526 [Thermoleophilaceae bacterium]|jgi:hypothetical protein|nr:hypothetical protein [Thermoleophilaceae bacterium]